jgi:hypothetical protein
VLRHAPLTAVKGGIDRLRPKGGTRADSLFDLVNAFITEEYQVVPRPGTLRNAALPPGTVGLTAFQDKFHVFASVDIDLTGYDDYALDILLHPFDQSAHVTDIHFAEPFMGALYVIAEFRNSYGEESIYHFWLQAGLPWQSSHEYSINEFVTPTTPNGYVYSAARLTPGYPAWAPGVARTAGNGSSIDPSIVEPTVYNEFFYEVIATTGDNPLSGSVEPEWPLATGATIVENTDGFDTQGANDVTPPALPPANTPQASTTEKYDR